MIIGLHGAAGSGKDTLANRVVQIPHMCMGFWSIYRMAGPLKAGLSAMFNIPMEDIENPALKNSPNYKFGRSIRYLAQTLGTEWGRNLVSDDVWVQMAKENISKLSEHSDVIITDVRFENEAKAIREMGGVIVNIVRPNNPHTVSVSNGGVASHSSENGLPAELVDFTIVNDKTIEDMLTEFKMIHMSVILNDVKKVGTIH